MSNGTNTGSSIDPNKERRIRIRNKEIQIIAEALYIYDNLPMSAPKEPERIQRMLNLIYGKEGSERKYSWSECHDITRRFRVLEDDDGYYARRSRE